MGKIMINDLAGVLAERHHIGKDKALQFLTALVETIRDGIADDGLVKVKGLGTFKLVDVDARESISVNSGERVVIDSHSKLTFLPDMAMKELVNRPFAQFDTVILHEGVSFDETSLNEDDDEVEPEVLVEEPAEQAEEPVAPIVEEPVEQPLIEPEPQPVKEPEPQPVKEPEQQPVKEPEPVAPAWLADTADSDDDDDDDVSISLPWWVWFLLALIACAASFAAGYFIGRNTSKSTISDEPKPVFVEQTDTTAAETPAKDTLTVDTSKTATATDTVKQAASPAKDEDWKKYEAMDNRVRLGAYRIVGTDQVIKARRGDTSRRIARRTLGEDMECYIEVYNGISGRDTLKAGQEVKLPKLEWKKSRKSRK